MRNFIILIAITSVVGCAGMNPNPGERTADTAWYLHQDYRRAVEIIRPAAERGEPWAQLRMGIFLTNGWGVSENREAAVSWYQKVLDQTGDDGWAQGKIIGDTGELGYFNLRSDQIIAEFNLSQLYYEGIGMPKNMTLAYVYVENVLRKSNGESIYFCCNFSTPLYFDQSQFVAHRQKILDVISSEELAVAEKQISAHSQSNKVPALQAGTH